MTPERWAQIKGTFQAALDCEPAARAVWLDEACADDAELRREVAALLAADATADEHTTWSLGGVAAAVLPELTDRLVGQRLGAYRLTALIGQGGMGAVFAAVRDDDQYRQQVAIKLVKAELTGGASAEAARQRFRRERQILARLEHPHIARLLDGGTTPEGWPYLVMEYIEGRRAARRRYGRRSKCYARRRQVAMLSVTACCKPKR